MVDSLLPILLDHSSGDKYIVDTFLWNSQEQDVSLHLFCKNWVLGFQCETEEPALLSEIVNKLKQEIDFNKHCLSFLHDGCRKNEGTLAVIPIHVVVGQIELRDSIIWNIHAFDSSIETFSYAYCEDLRLIDPPFPLTVSFLIRRALLLHHSGVQLLENFEVKTVVLSTPLPLSLSQISEKEILQYLLQQQQNVARNRHCVLSPLVYPSLVSSAYSSDSAIRRILRTVTPEDAIAASPSPSLGESATTPPPLATTAHLSVVSALSPQVSMQKSHSTVSLASPSNPPPTNKTVTVLPQQAQSKRRSRRLKPEVCKGQPRMNPPRKGRLQTLASL